MNTTRTVRDIAVGTPATMRVFENYKIDYCCGGHIPFAEACETAGVEVQQVWGDIERVLSEKTLTADDPSKWTQAALADHIVETHHEYTRGAIARLVPLLEKVCDRHGKQHAELMEIQAIFGSVARDMELHMHKEEQILFPFIKQLETARFGEYVPAHFGTVQNPVRMMMLEHDAAGEMLRRIRELSRDFTLPEGACPSFMGLYDGLEEFEKDLHRHVHLENNILFPRAIEMEPPAVRAAPNTFDPAACDHNHGH